MFHRFTWSVYSVVLLHRINPVHFVIDTAPVVLSATAYIIGRTIQHKEQQSQQKIAASEKRLYTILQNNPDAVFLVCTRSLTIEQYNCRALQLCDTTDEGIVGCSAPEFFSTLSESLSVLAHLQNEGDTFSSEMPCTTAQGKTFWGQVDTLTFALNEQCYQLVRIADITPVKQRELELNRARKELQEYSEELLMANEEVKAINNNLENIVQERTKLLSMRNQQLTEYAFLNAHKIRGPLSRILGSAGILEYASDECQKQLIVRHIVRSTEELDEVLHQIAKTVNVEEESK